MVIFECFQTFPNRHQVCVNVTATVFDERFVDPVRAKQKPMTLHAFVAFEFAHDSFKGKYPWNPTAMG